MYNPKNVLITGGSGFIGSNVLIYLVKKYPNINFINLDILDYCACQENLSDIQSLHNYKFIHGDICDANLINFILTEKNVDTIMHFAAQTHVCNSFGNSFTFTQTNVMGTHVLLECAKNYGQVNKFIHVSTDEVVGEDLYNVAMNENAKMNPSNPYAASKAGAELLVKSYYDSFKLPIIISRGNNVYGHHQYPEKMIPKFINQLMRGQRITIHGNGKNLRNFLHCEDVARAFETLLFKGVIGEIYNIGGSNEFQNITVAHKILDLLWKDIENKCDKNKDSMIMFVEDRNFNDFRYNITSEKLKLLGWKEEVGFEDGLKKTIEWYKQYGHRYENIENALKAHPTI